MNKQSAVVLLTSPGEASFCRALLETKKLVMYICTHACQLAEVDKDPAVPPTSFLAGVTTALSCIGSDVRMAARETAPAAYIVLLPFKNADILSYCSDAMEELPYSPRSVRPLSPYACSVPKPPAGIPTL